jgi:hypothetical protein
VVGNAFIIDDNAELPIVAVVPPFPPPVAVIIFEAGAGSAMVDGSVAAPTLPVMSADVVKGTS